MTVEDQPGPAEPVEQRIQRQLQALDDIQGRPLAEHADEYAAVHTQLQAALTEIDGGSA